MNTPRLPSVDGLRAMAMLMVFFFHIWQFAGSPQLNVQLGPYTVEILNHLSLGSRGVDVFMVLSGFCLFFPLAFREKPGENFDWKRYAVRRVRRIAPPYYAAIIYALGLRVGIAAVLIAAHKATAWPSLPSPLDLLAHVTFTHSLFESTFFGITGAFWSLGLEAQFYLAFPFVVWAFARLGWRVIIAMVAVSLFYHAITHALGVGTTVNVANFFLGRWMQFGAGMGVALLVASRVPNDKPLSTGRGISLLILALVLFWLPVPDWKPLLSSTALDSLKLSASTGVLLYALCTSTAPVRFLWSNKVSAFLGLISYSFFLIHQPTMQYFAQFLRQFAHLDGVTLFVALATLGLGICVAIACLFFRLFEKPFLTSWPIMARLRVAN